MAGQRTLTPYVGVQILRPQPGKFNTSPNMRLHLTTQGDVTPITWVFAPKWLTLEEASILSGLSLVQVLEVIAIGGVDLNDDGLIERQSLMEFMESLDLLLHWHE